MRYCRILVCAAVLVFAGAAMGQTAKKLRVLAAPGVTLTKPKDWKNTIGATGDDLIVHCPRCEPVSLISIPAADIAEIQYGDNAYHHWAAGAVTGFLTLGVGAIVGFMPHHQHYYSIDLKNGRVLAIQADKSDYKEIAGLLENLTGLPITASAKDAHFLAGYNVRIAASEGGK